MSSNNTKETASETQMVRVKRMSKDLFGDEGKLYEIMRKAAKNTGAMSNQGTNFGRRDHLINKTGAQSLRDYNVHHSACIDAKVGSSVGLGHRDEKIHEVLDPLCQFSWQDTLTAFTEDLIEGGDGHLEVVRGDLKDPEVVTGLFHVKGPSAYVEVEEQNNNRDFHYVVTGEATTGRDTVLARFGDLKNIKRRFGIGRGRKRSARASKRFQTMRSSSLSGHIMDSEMIHFRMATSRSSWYGYADWLAAVPSMELVQCMTQHEFDFYFNRGVPEFMLFLLGEGMQPDDFKKIEAALENGQGPGNSHKSNLFHIPTNPEDFQIQVERLAMEEQQGDAFSKKSDTLAMNTVSAHGVPPILAGVQISGKMGANNEGPNALMLFQKRKLSAIQRLVSATLACTLGMKGQKFSQPDGSVAILSREMFLAKGSKSQDDQGAPLFVQEGNGFNSILDGMDMGAMDTMARMQEPIVGSGRDPKEGLLGSQDDRPKGDPKGR